MKSSRFGFALAAAAIMAASCSPKAKVEITVSDAPASRIAVHKLNVSSSDLLDSVKLNAAGVAKFSVDVKKGEPEFIYLYRGDVRIASLLLEAGEKAVVVADTLGNYCVSGSEGSERLVEVEQAHKDFVAAMQSAPDSKTATRTYIDYYRGRVSFVLKNCHSLSVIPVLYQNVSTQMPVFSQATDAITFRSVCDSLKTVYPDSKYVKALERETQRRENNLGLQMTLSQAQEAGFPDILLPDVTSEKVALSGVDAKAILVHFWTCEDGAQNLFNEDILLPLYNQYHKRGLEIYSICITTDKAKWASVIRNQNLPWVNVCDGLGAASTVLSLYNVQSLPSSVLIANGEISTANIAGEKALRSELSKILK